MSLVTYVMKNIIKILVTDIKELSSLDKKRLIIFHDKYEIYDKWIIRIAFFQMLILGLGFGFFINEVFGFTNIVLGFTLLSWWSSKV